MARRLLAMTTTSSVLQHVVLSRETREKLVRTTYNRAVLVTEIQDYVLRNVLDIPEHDTAVINSNLRKIVLQLCAGELNTRGRHIPSVIRRPLDQDNEVAYQHTGAHTARLWTARRRGLMHRRGTSLWF